jgi:DNA-binding CsgD family transcriptional regulator
MVAVFSDSWINDLVAQIYDGVTDREAMSGALEELGSKTGHMGYNVVQINLAAGSFYTDIISTNDASHPLHAMLEDRANEINPYFRPEFASSIVGEATFANETMPRREVETTEFYNDYLKPGGVTDIAGFFSVLDGGILNTVSILRGARDGFTDEQKSIYRRLAPHAIRAFDLRHKLGVANQQKHILEQVLNQQTLGIVLFNSRAKITWLNRSATNTLGQKNGLAWRAEQLVIENRRLNDQFQKKLLSLINDASRQDAVLHQEAFFIPKASGLMPYSISLSPIQMDQAFCGNGSPVAVGLIADPMKNHSVTTGQMMTLYGLTPAEADIAIKLSFGMSLEDIASLNGHKVTTTRNLLKRAFAKTGTGRQAQLARLVWASALPVNLKR